eukprot:CAMPEP_0172589480 /NCGR_PEP_ID=MMETSP1068-20121228/8195_1 /TAXON_ID=35684 /ORGANISM="Pseudopedinella elastica, Strain CCMP716" /LENGTH=96 /DNA_ID=CAMNT_0013385087 /DNA_START=265 /DNA_END=555 /DNA_ORIENTATION=+
MDEEEVLNQKKGASRSIPKKKTVKADKAVFQLGEWAGAQNYVGKSTEFLRQLIWSSQDLFENSRQRPIELELELIQSHMAHKPVLRGEEDARALRE